MFNGDTVRQASIALFCYYAAWRSETTNRSTGRFRPFCLIVRVGHCTEHEMRQAMAYREDVGETHMAAGWVDLQMQ